MDIKEALKQSLAATRKPVAPAEEVSSEAQSERRASAKQISVEGGSRCDTVGPCFDTMFWPGPGKSAHWFECAVKGCSGRDGFSPMSTCFRSDAWNEGSARK